MLLSDTNMVNRLKQTAQEGSELLCITLAGKVTTPSLCCTILILESTVERRQTYKLLLYYVCRPEWGIVSQDMALTEQKPDLVVTYESAKPTKILLVELTVPWQFFKERQQGVKDWRKIWYRLALMHATSGIGCRGVRNAANLEYICNQVWIGSIKKLKGAFGRIALKGSYRIWLALNSKGLSGGELIKAQTWLISHPHVYL